MSKNKAKKKSPAESKPDLRGEELADKALDDPSTHKSIEEQLENLSTEEAEMFVKALELALKKRRWMLFGYLGSLVAVVVGAMIAFYVWGTREPGTFVGWVFLLPPAMAGAVIWCTGKYVKKIGT